MSGNKRKLRRIGIFGGSFDPVHSGHIRLAEDALKQVELEKVVFVPAGLQPFKLDKTPASGEARADMLRAALCGSDSFEISDYELASREVSYTYLTLRAMQRIYTDEAKLYFITGTDAFLKIEKWKQAEELLTNYSFIIGTRPGYKQAGLQLCIDRIRDVYGTEIINIDNVQIDASSTEIRRRLEMGQPLTGLVPESVERYIIENGLYKNRIT